MTAEITGRTPSARDVALRGVRDVFGKPPRGAREALDYRLRRASLDERDRAFATSLAYGSIRMRRRLDAELAPWLNQPIAKLPPAIAEVLRLGVYQLRFAGGVAPHAAVSESVSLALRYGHRGTAGLVNAVLRRVAESAAVEPAGDDDDTIALAASLPTWLVAHWRERFGPERLREIAAGINADAPIGLSVDLRRATREAVLAELAAAGIAAHPSALATDALVLDAHATADRIREVVGDRAELHAESACVPVDLLDPQPGERILEMCSGRGNKSLQIAARLGERGEVLAIDLDDASAEVARERLERAGVTNVATQVGDAAALRGAPDCDRVLVDAPCSGFGIVGRQPEARWRKTSSDPERFAPLQRRILDAAAACVKPGGLLVYAVCTTSALESEDVVDAFLRDHAGFARTALPDRYAAFAHGGDVLIPPGIGGRDGFYVARLQRT